MSCMRQCSVHAYACVTIGRTVMNISRFGRRTSFAVGWKTSPRSRRTRSTRSVSRTTCSPSCTTNRSAASSSLLGGLHTAYTPKFRLRLQFSIHTQCTHTHTRHARARAFNGPLSGTNRVRCRVISFMRRTPLISDHHATPP